MDDAKKRKLSPSSANGHSHPQAAPDSLRKLLDPLRKDQLVEFILNLSTKYPIAEEIAEFASADPVHRKLFVRGLSWETTSETLCAVYSAHGEIEEGAVIVDKVTGKSRGYGFITYRHLESAQKALQNPNKFIDGRLSVCTLAHEGLTGAPGPTDITSRKIYIAGLSQDTSTEALLSFFDKHGDIEEGSVAYNKETNMSRGFGFITFKTAEAAKRAIDDPNKILEGRTVTVKYADTSKNKSAQSQVPANLVPLTMQGAAGYQQPTKAQKEGSVPGYMAYTQGFAANQGAAYPAPVHPFSSYYSNFPVSNEVSGHHSLPGSYPFYGSRP